MRLAIPHWQGRVSPVFDVAGNLLMIDVDRSGEIRRQNIALRDDTPWGRAKYVADLRVDMLICGAISRELELALVSPSGMVETPRL
jgi:predicted Fe-Mo cluster-binding NifX family protein